MAAAHLARLCPLHYGDLRRLFGQPDTGRIALAAFLATGCAPAYSEEPHTAEIKTFGSIMAIARTVRDTCPQILSESVG